jgi:hypothetical protein
VVLVSLGTNLFPVDLIPSQDHAVIKVEPPVSLVVKIRKKEKIDQGRPFNNFK